MTTLAIFLTSCGISIIPLASSVPAMYKPAKKIVPKSHIHINEDLRPAHFLFSLIISYPNYYFTNDIEE